MNDKKVFDSKKGGRPDIRDESSGGFHYEEPKSPAITIRERADKTRDPLEYEAPTQSDKNYFNVRKQAAEGKEPRTTPQIESNEWGPFNTSRGGINDIKDDDTGGHHYAVPEIPNLDFTKSWRKK